MQFAAGSHLGDDVATAHQLAVDIELRDGRPIAVNLDALADFRVGQHVDVGVGGTGGSQGGDQQISSRISCNEIDLLLYFRNPIGAKATEPDEASLLRLCDVYNIPYATNIASAEAMIHALENGDLDWRDIVNPKA